MTNGKSNKNRAKNRKYKYKEPARAKTGQKHVFDLDRTIKITSPGANRKHYINLPEDDAHPEQGEWATVEAQVTPARQGIHVHWRIVAEESTFPDDRAVEPTLAGAALGASMKAGLVSRGTQSAITTTNGRGVARVRLYLPKYGGDEVTVSAGLRQDHDGSSRTLTVWRKLWVHIAHGNHVDVPIPAATLTAYKNSFVDLVERGRTRFTEQDTTGFRYGGGAVTTYYPRWMVDPGGNDDRVVVVGFQNQQNFYDKFKRNDTDRFFAIGDYGCNGSEANFTGKTELHQFEDVAFDKDTKLSDELELSEGVINPHPNEGALVVTGTWEVAYAEERLRGDVDASYIVFAPHGQIKIKWPDDLDAPCAWQTLQIVFTLTSAGGNFEPLKEKTLTVRIDSETRLSDAIALTHPVTEGGDVVVTGRWQIYTPEGTRNGALTDDDIVFEKDRGPMGEIPRARMKYIRIRWPEGEKLPGQADTADITLELNAVRATFAGLRYENSIIAVNSDALAGTFTHEIGHSVNQVLKDDTPPDGLPAHPFKYTGCGGQGPHCSMILQEAVPVKGVLVWWPKGNMNVYDRGDCVMHGGGGEQKPDEFCDVCKIYVRAQDMAEG